MAPKGNSKGPSTGGNGSGGRIKFRFVDIEMENVNESVTEGLKSLAAALSSRGPTYVSTRTLPRTVQALRSGAAGDPAETEEAALEADDVIEDSDDAGAEEAEMQSANGSGDAGGTKKLRVLRAPEFLSSVNLTLATTPLEAYLRDKNPESQVDKYLVIAQWFKEFMSTDEITVDHVYTAYETLGWRAQVPQDASGPLRSLKRSKLLDGGTARGSFKINWNGTKAVAAMNATV